MQDTAGMRPSGIDAVSVTASVDASVSKRRGPIIILIPSSSLRDAISQALRIISVQDMIESIIIEDSNAYKSTDIRTPPIKPQPSRIPLQVVCGAYPVSRHIRIIPQILPSLQANTVHAP